MPRHCWPSTPSTAMPSGMGAEFRFGERANAIAVKGGRVHGVKTDKGEYGTDVVINAAGPWASQVAQMVGLDMPVTPDSHEAAITEAVARFLDPMVVDIRPHARLIQLSTSISTIQGRSSFASLPARAFGALTPGRPVSSCPWSARRMLDVMPRLKNIRVRRTWRGLYPMTPDGFPIVGWSKEIEGYMFAVGMCGQGFMLGPGLGELLARMVQDDLEPEDLEVLADLSPYREFVGQEKLK